jgi:hypothetical protein
LEEAQIQAGLRRLVKTEASLQPLRP